jgi:hypothetical protein
MTEPKPKRVVRKSKPKGKTADTTPVPLTKAQLKRAAALRAEGATWNAIREKFGVRHGSSKWFALWREHGIEHIPARELRRKASDGKE